MAKRTVMEIIAIPTAQPTKGTGLQIGNTGMDLRHGLMGHSIRVPT
jgi:hypothetical protein